MFQDFASRSQAAETLVERRLRNQVSQLQKQGLV